ncbi:MAG: aminoacetone oxidase family FAD-binding enzyme [Anaerococcus sp.]|nr:aminoacetone oxidase family FAD-binding enzyme [Anaerococcus sp.]
MKIFVLGAGASGLALASFADGLDVNVIDKNDMAGRKLLATGNGRCNFTNQNLDLSFYQSSRKDFFKKALANFDNKDLIAYLNLLGVDSRSLPSGRFYPTTMQSSTIRDSLYLKAKDNASFIFNEEIVDIDLDKKLLISKNNKYKYDILVLAGGGISLKNSGSDGSIFKILKGKIPQTDLVLAISNYESPDSLSRAAKGVKITGKVSLFVDNKFLAGEVNDIIFQSYGLSGTGIFNISNLISLGLRDKKKVKVLVDFLPAYSKKGLFKRLEEIFESFPKRRIEDCLIGLINKRLIGDILSRAKIERGQKANKISNEDLKGLVDLLKGMEFRISDIHNKDQAQVTIGGFDTRYISDETMESSIYEGLYFIGEIMDVSGSCGGYNIQWAFSSAKACIESIRSIHV